MTIVSRTSRRVLNVLLTPLLLCCAVPVSAADAERDQEILELRRQLDAIRVEQDAKIRQIREETDAKVQRIEQALDQLAPGTAPKASATAAVPPPTKSATASAQAAATQISGDFRLRFEGNYADEAAPDRERGVLRARLAARHAISSSLSVGARLATGDADDPNSADVTLSSFDDDLDVSLDQAYARFETTRWTLIGGKFALPMTRTEMVWDGDVNPEGAAATVRIPWMPPGSDVRVSALYFVIDEQSTGRDSGMTGLQIADITDVSPNWRVELSAAYYDYDLHALTNADAGDIRGNRLNADGTGYLSDFDLLNVVGALQFGGIGPRWPIRLVGDIVRNLDSADAQRDGYNVELAIGQTRDPSNWRFGYGYSAVETDAVFAAFSHDNTQRSTNYRQHALSVDYVATAHTTVNATWYHYRAYRTLDLDEEAAHDWLDRIRLNFVVAF